MQRVFDGVMYQSQDIHYKVSREEQDIQEAKFSEYQEKLHNGTITKEESNALFAIIHNCILSQLRKRLSSPNYTGIPIKDCETVEETAIDGTLYLLKSMTERKRYVRYIIKTSGYIALYLLHNKKRKETDKMFKSSLSLEYVLETKSDLIIKDIEYKRKVRRKMSSLLKKYKKNMAKNKLEFDVEMYKNTYGSLGIALYRCYSLLNKESEENIKLKKKYVKNAWKNVKKGKIELPAINDKDFIKKMSDIYGIEFPYGNIAIVTSKMNSLFAPCFFEDEKLQIVPNREDGVMELTLKTGTPLAITRG